MSSYAPTCAALSQRQALPGATQARPVKAGPGAYILLDPLASSTMIEQNRNPRPQLEPQITSLEKCNVNSSISETPVYYISVVGVRGSYSIGEQIHNLDIAGRRVCSSVHAWFHPRLVSRESSQTALSYILFVCLFLGDA